MKTAVIFDNFGPYHLARLRAAATICDLLAVEVAASSAEYAWKREAEVSDTGNRPVDFKMITLLNQGISEGIPPIELAFKLNRALDDFRPRAVFIPGWSSSAAFAALSWCNRMSVPAVAMSESTEWDEKRVAWKEWAKRRIIGLCSAALVGGQPHKEYMVKLGMPPESVFTGYDAVDNDYFAKGAEEARSQESEIRRQHGLPENYFLASARFIEKKNLPRLLQAYARYREFAQKSEVRSQRSEEAKSGMPHPGPLPFASQRGEGNTPWDLVLLGDGPLRPALNSQLSALNVQAHVQMPGFKQYPDLPAYYGCAGAFIHASTTEQWGLVVNEAMASGLPVLVSNRCGCATDLVQEGVNGFTFDPENVEQLAQLMLRISNSQFPISDFGAASRRIISDWGTERCARGSKLAAEYAMEAGPRRAGWSQKFILEALLRAA